MHLLQMQACIATSSDVALLTAEHGWWESTCKEEGLCILLGHVVQPCLPHLIAALQLPGVARLLLQLAAARLEFWLLLLRSQAVITSI